MLDLPHGRKVHF